MTAEIQLAQSAHGLKRECLSYGEVIAQLIAVIACINPAARVFFMMARHGLLHASLGAAHE